MAEEGGKTEEEQVEETVAVAHLDSASPLEASIEFPSPWNREIGGLALSLVEQAGYMQVHTCDGMMLAWSSKDGKWKGE